MRGISIGWKNRWQELVSIIVVVALIADAGFRSKSGAWYPGPNPEYSKSVDRMQYAASIVLPILTALWVSEPVAAFIRSKRLSLEFQGSWIRAGAWTLLIALLVASMLNHL